MPARRSSGAGRALRRLRVALLPSPAQALALALLAAVVGAALASGPLLLGSTAESTWTAERVGRSAADLGVTVTSGTIPYLGEPDPTRIARAIDLDAAVRATAAEVGLGGAVHQVRSTNPVVVEVPGGAGLQAMQLVHRTGWEDHVRIVDGAISETGIVIPSGLAERAGVGPGDRLVVPGNGEVAPVLVEVSGVYAEFGGALPAYWEPVSEIFQPVPHPVTGDPLAAAPVALAGQQAVVSLATEAERDLSTTWLFALPDDLDLDAARTAQRRSDDLQVRLVDPDSTSGHVILSGIFNRAKATTQLPEVLDRVDRTVQLLRPSVRVVSWGAAAAGVVLVGAWAGQRVRRRHDELESLVTRGMSPAGGALQSAREALLPLALGGVAGVAAAWALVRTAGPSPRLPDGVVPESLVVAAAGAGAALLVVVLTTATLVARLDQLGRGTLGRSLGRVPWLAVATVAAAFAVVPVLRGEAGARGIDAATLALPLLLTLVVTGTVTAALPWLGRVTAGRAARLPPGTHLAVRRIVAARGAARLVVLTTALSVGLVVYAGALSDSTGRTLTVKAAVATGSDTVVPLNRQTREPGPLPTGATVVGSEEDATLLPAELRVDLLAVRPDEVADVMAWDDALADGTPEELLGRLTAGSGGRVPALLAGPVADADAVAPGTDLTLRYFSYYALPVEVVGRMAAFPGQESRTPLLVVDWDTVGAALEVQDRDPLAVFDQQVWAPGPSDVLLGALSDAGYAYDAAEVRRAEDFLARPEVGAQRQSLAYLRAVALAGGLLGLVGVGLHALAQQRRRTVAALLMARMGLSRLAADRSATLEIGLLALLGALLAVGTALPASALVLRLFDPDPALLPGPLFVVPWESVRGVLAGTLVATAAAGVLVARAARRARPGEVLRDAE